MEIKKNIYKIHGEGNVYLITKPEPFVIDTGSYTERENILTKISEIIDPKKITAVLLTHMHYDHSGNVNLFPKAKIYAHKKELEDYKEDTGYFFFGKVPPEIEHALKKLEPLPKKIFGLRIEEVPGHTRGSVYLVDDKEKLLFSGDTVFHNGIGRTDLKNSEPEKMMESIKKIYEEIRTKKLELMPGHDY